MSSRQRREVLASWTMSRYRYSGSAGERRNAVIDYTASWVHVSRYSRPQVELTWNQVTIPGLESLRQRKEEERKDERIEIRMTSQSVLSNPTIFFPKGTSVFASRRSFLFAGKLHREDAGISDVFRSSSRISLWFAFTHPPSFQLDLWRNEFSKISETLLEIVVAFLSRYCDSSFFFASSFSFFLIIELWENFVISSTVLYVSHRLHFYEKSLYFPAVFVIAYPSSSPLTFSHHVLTPLKRGVNWMP